jgi:ATP-binding cassette subfamily C protein EexD
VSQKVVKNKLQEALSKVRKSFLYAGFFSLFINLLALVPSLYMLQVYDRVMKSRSLETLLFLTIIVAVLFLTMGVLNIIRSKVLVRISNNIDLSLSPKLYDIVFENSRLNPAHANATPLTDLTKLRQYITGQGIIALFDVPWFPIYLFVMYIFSPFLAYFTIFAAIVIFTITLINNNKTKTKIELANKLNSQSNFYVNKNLQNSEIIHAMGMAKNIKKRWLEKHLAFLSSQSIASDEASVWTNSSKTLRQFFQSLTYGIGAYLAIKGEISAGTIIAGAVLLGRALAPLDLLTNSWKGFAEAKMAYKRLNKLLQNFSENQEKMDLPEPKGELSIENIIVVPPLAKKPTLRGINMKIPKGTAVGIVGPSGSGKSTLARAVLGVWPLYAGVVRLDGADIHQWDPIKLGPYIGYLPQDIELFEGTISENIARFEKIDPKKVVEAAQIAGVHEMILKFPDGYDTKIGPGGIGLSGGQRQRVGFARAIYNYPKLVVLDEPNSNLDADGEKALLEAIKILKQKGTTVIIITHKTNILTVTDLIAVLKDGTLQMYGNTTEVLVKLGIIKPKKQEQPFGQVSLSKPIS